MKAQFLKKESGRDFRVKKYAGVAALFLHRHEVREDAVHEPLSPVGVIDGEAAQRVGVAAPCSDGGAALIIDGAGIVEVSIQADTFALQKSAHGFSARRI